MRFDLSNWKYSLYIDGKQLVKFDIERDLEIIVVFFDCKLMRSFYLTYIRPYLEFVVSVWSPFLKGNMNMIKQVQQQATKLILAIMEA